MAATTHDQAVSGDQTVTQEALATLNRFAEMNAKLGGLFTQAQAALLCRCTRQYIGDLVREGRLHLHEFAFQGDGEPQVLGRYISGHQIARYLDTERRPVGRPGKIRMLAASVQNK